MENMPKVFLKAGHSNIRIIIDRFEVFIKRPKSLDFQAATWSDNKSHDTVKFLIGALPTGYVTFLPACYSGRSSAKFITADSGFYDCLDLYDEVMTDKVFKLRRNLR